MDVMITLPCPIERVEELVAAHHLWLQSPPAVTTTTAGPQAWGGDSDDAKLVATLIHTGKFGWAVSIPLLQLLAETTSRTEPRSAGALAELLTVSASAVFGATGAIKNACADVRRLSPIQFQYTPDGPLYWMEPDVAKVFLTAFELITI